MKRLRKILVGTLVCLVLLYFGLIIVAFLPHSTIPVEELAGKDSKFIKVKDHTVHYSKQGRGKPLILVHGFDGSTYTWRYIIPLLTDHYTVFALDLLGFGLTDKPPKGNYELDFQGDLVVGFMDALQLPSATLVGHSLGGIVVSYTALRAPSKVKGLVLIEPGFYSHGAPAFLQYLFFPLQRIMARQSFTKNFRKQLLSNSFYNKSLVTDEVVEAYLMATRTPNALEARVHMMNSVGPRVYEGIAEKISQPTLIVWGQNDERDGGGRSKDAQRLYNEIKRSRLSFIEASGHYVQEEKPQELVQIIKEFVR
jgi:pimeloyl-ACP methyl ester carboxylesterase